MRSPNIRSSRAKPRKQKGLQDGNQDAEIAQLEAFIFRLLKEILQGAAA